MSNVLTGKKLRDVGGVGIRKGQYLQIVSTIQYVRDTFKQQLSRETPGSQSPLKDSVAHSLGELG
jgi:hypothetical protein